jgi:putative nucleotidyltransferase with HDIG domain
LRVFRFEALLKKCKQNSQVHISPDSLDWVRSNAGLINTIAPERINTEIWQLLESECSFSTLKNCLQSGLWEVIFPEFTELRKVPANDFHHLPLIEHTFELINQLENLVLSQLPAQCLKKITSDTINSIPLIAVTKMACLLHDIAKPETWKVINGKHTFYSHDTLGAKTVEYIGKRLLWPKAVTHSITKLVEFHLRPFHIAPIGNEPTEKAERRFFRKLGDDFYPLIALAWADLLSTRGQSISQMAIDQSQSRLLKLCKAYKAFTTQENEIEPFLEGDLLKQAIQESKLPPTKLIKERLAELRELQLSGKITSTQKAFEWFVSTQNT